MNHGAPQEPPDPAGTVTQSTFLADALAGLAREPPSLPCKYLYDATGSELFDRICTLADYYPTRTELGILSTHGSVLGRGMGRDCLVVELGSGSSNKTRALLDHLEGPAAYVPVDISREHLERAAASVGAAYPGLEVLPVCADYMAPFALPEPRRIPRRRLVFFPGSTIGNLDPPQAQTFLERLAVMAGPGGELLVGVDLIKDRAVLHRAYDDPEGVTTAFNRNLLFRLRRELKAEVEPEGFAHEARFNEELGCMEMHLVSLGDRTIRLAGQEFHLGEGRSIRTERSYKYTLQGFRDLAEAAGWEPVAAWTDDRQWFSLHRLRIPHGNRRGGLESGGLSK